MSKTIHKTTEKIKGGVILVPGISGGIHTDKYNYLIKPLNADGFDVIFLQPWKDPEDLNNKTIKEILDQIHSEIDASRKSYDKLIGPGKSFGGFCILMSDRNTLDKMVLVNPAFNAEETVSNILDIESKKLSDIESIQDIKPGEALLNDAATKTLLIHGNKDNIVPLENSEVLSDKLLNSKIEVIHDMGHSVDTEYFKERVAEIVTIFSID